MSIFTASANPGLIAQGAAQRAKAVRDALNDAQNFFAWISAQSDADLQTLGLSEDDITRMKSMAADLSALNTIYHGTPPPASYNLPYPFINSSTLVIPPA